MIGILILLTFLVAVGGLVYFIAWLRAKETVGVWTKTAVASPFFRIGLLGGIVLISQIPMFFVENILFERIEFSDQITQEIQKDAGGQQMINGPYLVVPYKFEQGTNRQPVLDDQGQPLRDDQGQAITEIVPRLMDAQLVIWPETFLVNNSLTAVEKSRSIYQTITYSSSTDFNLSYAPIEASVNGKKIVEVDTEGAYITFKLTNPASLQSGSVVSADSIENSEFEAGASDLPGNIQAPISLPDDFLQNGMTAKVSLNLSGAGNLEFVPMGKQNEITITSDWPHPSFFGTSPGHRDIGPLGFVATWKPSAIASEFRRPVRYSQRVTTIDKSKVIGVSLFDRFGTYGLIDRAIKYALVIIGLTMATIFVIDQSSARRMHPLQYLIVGGGLGMFYLLLLSISEVLGFTIAFAIAAGALSLTVGGYIASALRSLPRGLLIALSLGGLYALLLTLLNLEDFALLVGSGLLFLVLIIIMMVTRNMGSEKPAA